MSEATRLAFAIASASYAQWLATGQAQPSSSALLDLEHAGSDVYNRESAAKQELLAKALSLEPRFTAFGVPRIHLLNAVRKAGVSLANWSSGGADLASAFARGLATDPDAGVRYLLAGFVAAGLTPASWDPAVRAALVSAGRSVGVMPWTTTQAGAVRTAIASATTVLDRRAPLLVAVTPPPSRSMPARTPPPYPALYTSASPPIAPPSGYLRLALGGAAALTLVVGVLVARRLRSRTA